MPTNLFNLTEEIMRLKTLSLALLGASALPSYAFVNSTFDFDDEGWSSSAESVGFRFADDIGNPPGAITARDRVGGATWYFLAPESYLGDQQSSFRGVLSFDLMIDAPANQFRASLSDVVLEGNGLRLVNNFDPLPTTTWTTFSTTLDGESTWRVGGNSGPLATNAQFMLALQDVTSIQIRGEFRNGNDRAWLDNVTLADAEVIVPEPSQAMALLVMLGAGLGLRRR